MRYVKVRRAGPQILWAGLEVLGPKVDVEEKEKEERTKIKVLFFSFFVSLLSMLSHVSPRSRYLLLVP